MPTLFDLHPGRIVLVSWGSGLVPTAETIQDTVAFATRHYAITAAGIVLTEADRSNIARRGITPPSGFRISAKARRLQEALLLPLEVPYLELDEN